MPTLFPKGTLQNMRSMTAFGRATVAGEGYELTVELRSVNNRYLDLNFRLPRAWAAMEERIKSALSAKAAADEIIVIDGLQVEEIKTKAFKAFLDKVGVEKKALVVTENVDEKVIKSARNIEGVTTTIATILSPYMILTSGKIVVDKAALAKIEEVFA